MLHFLLFYLCYILKWSWFNLAFHELTNRLQFPWQTHVWEALFQTMATVLCRWFGSSMLRIRENGYINPNSVKRDIFSFSVLHSALYLSRAWIRPGKCIKMFHVDFNLNSRFAWLRNGNMINPYKDVDPLVSCL